MNSKLSKYKPQAISDSICPFNQTKFSWYPGTKVLYQQQECTIHKILSIPNKADINDKIIVKFKNGNLQKYYRYQLESTPNYITTIQKLKQLTPGCSVDFYCPITKQWTPGYIEDRLPDKKSFLVNGNAFQLRPNKLRCSLSLSNLKLGSNIFVFSNGWYYSRIIDVIPFHDQHKPHIFKIHYYKNNKIYMKYVNQYSSTIALMKDELKCSVNDEKITNAKIIDTDQTDYTYYLLLLQGYVRETFGNHIHSDILSIAIKYIGCLYGLIMTIELKTWRSVINARDNYYMPIIKPKNIQIQSDIYTEESKNDTVEFHYRAHRKISLSISIFSDVGSDIIAHRSPTPLHPTELQLKNKLIQRGHFDDNSFQKAKHLAQNEKTYYESLVAKRNAFDDEYDYEQEIMVYNNNLEFCSNNCNQQYQSDNTDISLSFEFGEDMDLQSDWGNL